MHTNPNAPSFILASVNRIYDELPSLVGVEAWNSIQPQVDEHIATLEAQPDAYLAFTQLVGLLAQYELARQRLAAEIKIQETITHNISEAIAAMNLVADDNLLAIMYAGMSWDVDPTTVPSPDEDVKMRSIIMKEGGISGGKSIKFRNLDIDLSKMLTIGGGFILAVDDIIENPRPFVIAGGLLVMVGTLLSEMIIKIEQQDATVFWGMIQATGTMKGAGLHVATIHTATNTERAKYGLDALTESQIRASLAKLVGLKSVMQIGDAYYISEKFKVKEKE